MNLLLQPSMMIILCLQWWRDGGKCKVAGCLQCVSWARADKVSIPSMIRDWWGAMLMDYMSLAVLHHYPFYFERRLIDSQQSIGQLVVSATSFRKVGRKQPDFLQDIIFFISQFMDFFSKISITACLLHCVNVEA